MFLFVFVRSDSWPLRSSSLLSTAASLLSPGNVLIPPTEKARKLCDYVRVAIGLHFFLAIFLMIGGRYVDGVFDFLGALVGLFSIKNPEGYSFSCVLCYCVFTGMDVFWACLRLILYFSGASSTDSGELSGYGPLAASPLQRLLESVPPIELLTLLPALLLVHSWQYYVYIIGMIVAPFIYVRNHTHTHTSCESMAVALRRHERSDSKRPLRLIPAFHSHVHAPLPCAFVLVCLRRCPARALLLCSSLLSPSPRG